MLLLLYIFVGLKVFTMENTRFYLAIPFAFSRGNLKISDIRNNENSKRHCAKMQ